MSDESEKLFKTRTRYVVETNTAEIKDWINEYLAENLQDKVYHLSELFDDDNQELVRKKLITNLVDKSLLITNPQASATQASATHASATQASVKQVVEALIKDLGCDDPAEAHIQAALLGIALQRLTPKMICALADKNTEWAKDWINEYLAENLQGSVSHLSDMFDGKNRELVKSTLIKSLLEKGLFIAKFGNDGPSVPGALKDEVNVLINDLGCDHVNEARAEAIVLGKELERLSPAFDCVLKTDAKKPVRREQPVRRQHTEKPSVDLTNMFTESDDCVLKTDARKLVQREHTEKPSVYTNMFTESDGPINSGGSAWGSAGATFNYATAAKEKSFSTITINSTPTNNIEDDDEPSTGPSI